MNQPSHKAKKTSLPKAVERSLPIVPTKLPMAALTSSKLATRGLSELAECLPVVQELPSLPVATHGHVVISDEANERVLVMGGRGNASVWSFVFQDWRWQQIAAEGLSGELLYPAVALDAQRGRVICFGGWQGRNAPAIGDLLVLPLGGKTPLRWQTIEGRADWPKARYGASLAVDVRGDRAFLFGGDAGGWTGESKLCGDLWTLSLDSLQWRLVWRRQEPWLMRRYHRMAYDSIRDHLIIHGGRTRDAGSLSTSSDNIVAVVQVKADRRSWLAPKGRLRSGIVSAYVPGLRSIVGVGGGVEGSEGPAGPHHLWSYNLDDFRCSSVLIPEGTIKQPRDDHSACFCCHRRALFCVGGKNAVPAQQETSAGGGQTNAYLVSLDKLCSLSRADVRVHSQEDVGNRNE